MFSPALCTSKKCEKRGTCNRANAKPKEGQLYAPFSLVSKGPCDFYMPVEEETK